MQLCGVLPGRAHTNACRSNLSFVVHHASLVRLFGPYLACLCLAMKPTAPLLALPCSGMKPPSPLRAIKSPFRAILREQRLWRFQWGVQRGEQRCCRFQSRPVIASCARKSSPCMIKTCEKRCFRLRWANFFAEEPLHALIVSVCMCVRSPCGHRSSAGDKFRMQFPSGHFK